MSLDLNAVCQGIIDSMPHKGTNNNFLTDNKGKVVSVLGKDVYLWHPDIYHMPNDTYFTFMPFYELVTHDDSPSLAYVMKMINEELNLLMMDMIPAVLSAAVDIKTPNRRQKELLGDEINKVEPATVEFVTKLIKKVKLSHKTRSIVDVSTVASHPQTHEVDGHKYAVLKSPLLHAIAYHSGKEKLFDLPAPAKRDMAIVRAIVRMLLPAQFEGGSYFVGSKHSLIPRNKALHDIYVDMLDHIDEIISTLKIKGVEVPTVSENWTKGLTMMANLLQGVPRDILGIQGKVKVGVDVPKEEPRLVVTEGFGAGQNTGLMSSANARPSGGLLGLQMQQNPFFAMNAMSMMNPAMAMAMNNGFGFPTGGHGQTHTTPPPSVDANVPAGGLLNMR